MKDLSSPFKWEHFGYKNIGWNPFPDPFTKGQKFCWVPLVPKLVVQIWCGLRAGGLA